MSILDTLINVASASAANRRAFEYTKALQQHQFDLNKQALREYYTNNRYSLVSAGYNPLLAVPGSTAQGFSASASMSPVMPGSSGAGTDEANAVNSALSGKQQRALQREQVEQTKQNTENIKLRNDNQKLQNQKLENEINTSPRTVLSEIITNGETKTGNSALSRLTSLKNSYGLGFIKPRSFIKTNISRVKNMANNVKSSFSANSSVNNGKPFELGIKYFDEPKKKDETIGIWNSKRRLEGRVLSDNEAKKYLSRKSSRDYNKPPKSFPY